MEGSWGGVLQSIQQGRCTTRHGAGTWGEAQRELRNLPMGMDCQEDGCVRRMERVGCGWERDLRSRRTRVQTSGRK